MTETAIPLILSSALQMQRRMMRADGTLDARYLQMRCDTAGCLLPATVTPAIFVPSRTPFADGHRQLRMFTTLHCCAGHLGMFKLDELLNDRQKANFEAVAKKARPIDFICDFDAAHLTYTDVASGSYQAFLAQLEVRRG